MPSTRPLNVVHFNTYGPIGGAARAAYNIHRSVLEAGCESWLVVAERAGNDERMMECGTGTQARRTNFINRHRQTAMIRQLRPDEVFYPDILTRASLANLPLFADIAVEMDAEEEAISLSSPTAQLASKPAA